MAFAIAGLVLLILSALTFAVGMARKAGRHDKAADIG